MEALRDYLLSEGTVLLGYVAHPFSFASVRTSTLQVYENGEARTFKFPRVEAPQIVLYVKDFLANITLALFLRRRFTFSVGADPLNALSGNLLRRLGLVQHSVYYAIDYVPFRFGLRVINRLYHAIDLYCVAKSDVTWNLSSAMSEARIQAGLRTGTQFEVPLGTEPGDAGEVSKSEYLSDRIVFVGHLRRGHGLEKILLAFSRALAIVPTARLVIIGDGPLAGFLHSEARELGILASVDFTGYISSRNLVSGIISSCGFGLAPYEPSSDSFTWFADPGKPKHYLSCGLPVIITDVPRISKAISEREAGLVIRYDEGELADAMVALMSDKAKLQKMRANALKLSSEYSWSVIFDKALDCTFRRVFLGTSLDSQDY